MPYYPNYYSNYYPQQQMPQQIQQPQTVQTQNGGFISVPSEEIVNTYPVAPGNCVTFKIEGKPIVMEKSMGFSQLEAPRIERYRLVKEEPKTAHTEPVEKELSNLPTDELKAEIGRIWSEIEAIKKEFPKKKKQEVNENDAES